MRSNLYSKIIRCFRQSTLALFFIVASLHVVAAPGDVLFAEYFNNTTDLTNDWDRSSGSDVGVSTATFLSAPRSAFLRQGSQTLTLRADRAINAAVPAVELSVWIRRGDNSFSERPDAGEDLWLQYLNNTGTWVTLEVFTGSGTAGEIFTRVYSMPSAGLYNGLRFRFWAIDGNNNADYWHVDDVVVTERAAPISLVGYWQLDGTGWNGTAGEVNDSSLNSLHGFAVARSGFFPAASSTTPAIAGVTGTCGYGVFDGANRGFIQVNDPGANSALDLPNALTVAVWIRPRALPASGLMSIVSKDTNFEFHLNAAGQVNWWWGGGVRELTTTGAPLLTNAWYHIAITYIAGAQRIYINGVQRAAGATTGALTLNNDPVFIGTDLDFDSRTFDGFIDELRIYDGPLSQAEVQAVMAETHPCPASGLDHYRISFDGGASVNNATGITCEPVAVTIVAHGAGHIEPVTPGVGTAIQLSTSTGNGYWSNPTVGSVVNNGGGNATYTFAGNQSVTLQFNHTVPALNPAPVNININSASAPNEDPGEDPSVQFFETGFRFIDGANVPSITSQTSAVVSAIHRLQAIRTDTQTGQCVNVFPASSQVSVELAAECNNPVSCAGLQVAFTNNGNTVNLATNNNNGVAGAASYTTFANLFFSASSEAEFTFSYPDVGAISLHARYPMLNNDGSASGNFMVGSSNAFVVRPADLVITQVDDGVTANPGTTNTGAGFVAAGDPFRAFVQARNALGNITPNFGNEIVPENVALQLNSLVFPAGGNLGALSNAASFTPTGTAGEFANSVLAWNDVGTITLIATIGDGDYLGTGNLLGTSSANVGRFHPAYFSLISSSVNNSCAAGGFSYLSNPAIAVNYQLEANNRGGARVVNYDNTDLVYPTAGISHHAENSNDGNDLAARLMVGTSSWNDGLYTLADTGANLLRRVDGSMNVLVDSPLTQVTLGLQIADLDSVNFDTLNFKPSDTNNCSVDLDCDSRSLSGSLNAIFGRLYAADVHGPESTAIPMVWQTEYWNGNRFVLNQADHCTQLPLSAVDFVGASSVVDAVNDLITVSLTGADSVFDFGDPNGASDCLFASAIGFCDGRAGIGYGAPGTMINYPIDIDLSGLPYLQSDWNQDGSFDDASHPRFTVRFQHYRGHDRVIYWRELLQ